MLCACAALSIAARLPCSSILSSPLFGCEDDRIDKPTQGFSGSGVQGRMDRKTAAAHIASWATAHLDESDRAAFREVAETELLGLHEGNFARYPIRPAELTAWQEVWGPRGT